MANLVENQQLLPSEGELTAPTMSTTRSQMRTKLGSQTVQHVLHGTPSDRAQQSIIPSHSQAPRKPLNPDAAAYEVALQLPQHGASSRGSGWTWEYLALVLSASTVAALIVMLVYIDNLRLSHWKLPISPTTTVSILAATSRASLGFAISSCVGQAKWNWLRKRPDKLLAFDRFDDASRGPWGSFWLILWVKASHVVTIGAVVTIILLAFEPSFQAIVSIEGSIAPSDAGRTARLGLSESLRIGTYRPHQSQLYPPNVNVLLAINPYSWLLPSSGPFYQPDLGLVSSINSGFYSLPAAQKQTASFLCPTANCTWAPFTTLAVCSTCNDVTSSVTRRRVNASFNMSFPGLYSIGGEDWTIVSLQNLNLTNISTGKVSNGSSTSEGGTVSFMSATRATNPQQTVSFQNSSKAMITAVQILKAADGYMDGNLMWDDAPVTGTECALYFCVNAYKSEVIQGELKEEIIASWSERDPASYQKTSNYSNELVKDGEAQREDSLYPPNGVDQARYDLTLFIPLDDVHHLGLPEDVRIRFNLSQSTIGSTALFVNDEFFSTFMLWPNSHLPGVPPVVQALYQSTNISATFEKAAASITNWIRDVSNATQVGIAQEWTIRMHVEWAYIATPLVTFILGIGFCIFSVMETRWLGLQPWKTDTIATLTHSVDAETRAQLRHAYHHGYLDRAAKIMVVMFEDAGDGLELKIKQD